MTRFARIQGTHKPSFNKVSEDATPWEEMKRPLETSSDSDNEEVKEEQGPEEQIQTPKKFVPVNTVWYEFDEDNSKNGNRNLKNEESQGIDCEEPVKIKKKKKSKQSIENPQDDLETGEISKDKETNPEAKNIKQKKNKRKNTEEAIDEKSPKIAQKKTKNKSNTDHCIESETLHNKEAQEQDDERQSQLDNAKEQVGESEKSEGNKSFKRRKPDQGDMSISIDGQDVQISRFDGFYVMEHDKKRLIDLGTKLKKEGLPKDKINFMVTKQRRIAEKALARKKKKLCFQCRRSGHNLTECPELSSEGTPAPVGAGICYKCGSTEHSLYQCKIPGNELKFATCFICKEQGHLSKNCPDNPRGLYPMGGGCRNCGDVTHLKQDCPKGFKKNINNKTPFTVTTFKKNKFESVDDDFQEDTKTSHNVLHNKTHYNSNKPKKIIFK